MRCVAVSDNVAWLCSQLGASAYDAGTNTQATPITIAKGKFPEVVNLLVLTFSDTQSNSSAPLGTGFSDLKLLMPGYAAGSTSKPTPLFSDDWAALLKPLDHVRWMGATGTNSYSWLCGGANAAGCSVIRWEDRTLPSYAYVDIKLCLGCHGMPWEHVLLAANEMNQDVWINVPVSASAPTVCRTKAVAEGGDPHKCLDADPESTYEYQLALLFKNGNEFTNHVGLKPGLKIYVEYG